MPFSLMQYSIMTLCISRLSIMTQYNSKYETFDKTVKNLKFKIYCHAIQCHHAAWRYAYCHFTQFRHAGCLYIDCLYVECHSTRAENIWKNLNDWSVWKKYEESSSIKTVHNRHQCRKTTVLGCHRCLINTGVEKNELHLKKIRTLTTRCLWVRVNVDIQMIVYIFWSALFNCLIPVSFVYVKFLRISRQLNRLLKNFLIFILKLETVSQMSVQFSW